MAASRPSRASGTAARRISGSPRSQSPAAGTWRATLARSGAPAECGTITRDIAVRADRPPPPSATPGSVWPLRNTWNRATENLFSAWIEKLFDDPLDAAPSWPALHEVLRDRSRNVLFNHLGLGEDEMKIVIRPDCADLPYFLRAYFAFKMGLPFGYSNCSRGGGGAAPTVRDWFSIVRARALRRTGSPLPRSAAPGCRASRRAPPQAAWARRRRSRAICRTLADGVHSGSGRTAANDNNTDYYPVALKQETLRPGTVYADPYGHVLMIVRRVPQTNGDGRHHPRGRRPARRHGGAQALLARQFPVRAGSRARRPGLQALPADRARQERRACGG